VTNDRQAGVIPPKQPARRAAAPREDATDNANQVCVEPLTSGGSADVAQQDVGRGQRLSHQDGLPDMSCRSFCRKISPPAYPRS